MTNIEAAFLKSQILKCQPNTLLGFILENNVSLEKHETFESFSDMIINSVSKDMADMIKLAQDINRFVLLITTRYNIIISKRKNNVANDGWKHIYSDLNRHANVDLDSLFERLPGINTKLKTFLFNVQNAVFNNDIDLVDKLIISREVSHKDRILILPDSIDLTTYISDYNRSHFTYRANTMLAGNKFSEGWTGMSTFDYRYSHARRIINDILNAGEAAHV